MLFLIQLPCPVINTFANHFSHDQHVQYFEFNEYDSNSIMQYTQLKQINS